MSLNTGGVKPLTIGEGWPLIIKCLRTGKAGRYTIERRKSLLIQSKPGKPLCRPLFGNNSLAEYLDDYDSDPQDSLKEKMEIYYKDSQNYANKLRQLFKDKPIITKDKWMSFDLTDQQSRTMDKQNANKIWKKISDFVFYKPKKSEILQALSKKKPNKSGKPRRNQYAKRSLKSKGDERGVKTSKNITEPACCTNLKSPDFLCSLPEPGSVNQAVPISPCQAKPAAARKCLIIRKLTDYLKEQDVIHTRPKRKRNTTNNAYKYIRQSLKPSKKFQPLLSRNNSISFADETETSMASSTPAQIISGADRLRQSLEFLKQNVISSTSPVNSPDPCIKKRTSLDGTGKTTQVGRDREFSDYSNPLYKSKRYKKAWMNESFSLTLSCQPDLPSGIRSTCQ
ncbi:unnamed protein product [Moneuplotes crassus]|uniref:Uncharacterized protein n=1 Tax=Euplotes crassus TaxID=5936 RepID=A0AAD2DA19_EUPCR|nr:unnamed protein product [Moneuplotes crassus]